MENIFITATDTGVGKTLVSTLITLGLKQKGFSYNHYKPVQSGVVTHNKKNLPPDLFFSSKYLDESNDPEKYCSQRNLYTFKFAASPDLAAAKENIDVDLSTFVPHYRMAQRMGNLIVEGAGGAVVPIVNNYCMFDLINDYNLPAIVVTRSSLGTLNHTYLTVHFLRSVFIDVKGIIVCDTPEIDETIRNRNIIQMKEMNNLPVLGVVPWQGIDSEGDFSKWPEKNEMIQLAEKCFQWDSITKILS